MDNPDKLYPPEAAAERLGSKPATMQWWRVMGRGPRPIHSRVNAGVDRRSHHATLWERA